MAATPTLTAFSIRKDGVEVKQPSGTAAQAGADEWESFEARAYFQMDEVQP